LTSGCATDILDELIERNMSRSKNRTGELTKKHRSRLLEQHREHNRRLKQTGRHSECLSFDEYVKYVYGKSQSYIQKSKTHYQPPEPYRRKTERVPSLGHGVGNASRSEIPEYTGTYIKGISVTHKSNLVPVTSSDQAKDISKMSQ